MNIIESLVKRIESRLLETKNACKTYATEDKAVKVADEFSKKLGSYFDSTGRASRYVIVFIPSLNRYTPAFDYSELFSRNTSKGGYVGVASDAGFYSF